MGWPLNKAFSEVFRPLAVWLAACVAALFAVTFGLSLLSSAGAQEVPRSAVKHRAELTRIARAEWGLSAPVATFAAQIHQESGWNPTALSRVGAQGMAQFMPDTATWWCSLNDLDATECQPSNPTWSMRALVGYDRWLYERVRGPTDFDLMWATLRSYNGGLGNWQREAALSKTEDHTAIDAFCGRARRAAAHCPENIGYPNRILLTIQPRYATWGGYLEGTR